MQETAQESEQQSQGLISTRASVSPWFQCCSRHAGPFPRDLLLSSRHGRSWGLAVQRVLFEKGGMKLQVNLLEHGVVAPGDVVEGKKGSSFEKQVWGRTGTFSLF